MFITEHPNELTIQPNTNIYFNESICTSKGEGISAVTVTTEDISYLYRLSFTYSNNSITDVEVVPYASY